MNAIIPKSCLIAVLLGSLPAMAQKHSRFEEHPSERRAFIAQLAKRAAEDKENAKAWARQHGVPLREKRGHQVIQLMAIRNGMPLYYTTFNKRAEISTATDLVGNISPYNLDGAGITVGVWDGGWIRSTHQEFGSRVTIKDSDPESFGLDDHATHVGGTISASGMDSNAKGMAPAVTIDSYGWDSDLSEMGIAAASAPGQTAKIYLSNHSYGLLNPASLLGQYMEETELIDQQVESFQYYLPFIAAGNEQSMGGYDTISYFGIAKNVITVGAVQDAVSGTTRSTANATMTSFSSWGPTDDGRIKPDIVANGYELYSTVSTGDSAYQQASWSGTSMATPNACGSAALLVEYYKELFSGGAMRASTLKGLIIHTADDLGNTGPDYKFGWGLMNTLAAAELLKEYSEGANGKLTEATVTASQNTDTYVFQWNGVDPIRATLCWTDPAGTSTTANDSRIPVLKHDLDLKITGPGGTYYPYKLSYSNPSANATASGENNIDNVEQVYIPTPLMGTYTITVDYDGSLTGGAQRYSLLVSGDWVDFDSDGLPNSWETLHFGGFTNAVASADPDGDGSDNLEEYISGYDPTNPNSVFEIVSFSAPASESAPFIVTWSPVEGRIYNVLWTDNLLYTPFTNNNLSGDLPYPANSYTDTSERTAIQNFYRVDVRLDQ